MTERTPNWTAAWTAAMHGPYPVGNATGQPEMAFVFPAPERGAVDQSFRMIVRPDVWGHEARLRLSNAFGTRPVTFDQIHIGLQLAGSAVMPGTNRPVTFAGRRSVTIGPGEYKASDSVPLDFIGDVNDPMLRGRKLSVSYHVVGDSGPITWHAKALQTSYLTGPGTGARAGDENEAAFPYPTTSWYFLDLVEMNMAEPTHVVVAFGDSITDGTGSTISGDDRWPDVLSRRLRSMFGNKVSVVNQGIGGNQVIGPARYTPANAIAGGPSALSRLERDVISLSGVKTVIWMEGINDFGAADATVEAVSEGLRNGVAHLRRAIPGVHIVLATLTSCLNSSIATHGRATVDAKRKTYNDFIRSAGIADAVIDFDIATLDQASGQLRPEMWPSSSIGGPGDGLHPNRVGYQAMGHAIELASLFAGRDLSGQSRVLHLELPNRVEQP